MFRRRVKTTLVRRLRNWVWPDMGWPRWLRYFGHRMGRLPGTPYDIAAGLACGAAVSFTPFMGLHFLLGAGLAFVIRASVIASAVGTAAGNPWTFPLIWAGTYRLGEAILGAPANPGQAPESVGLVAIFQQPQELLIPMAMGSSICVPIVWLATFVPCYHLIARYQAHRRRRMRRKHLREAAREMGHGPGNEERDDRH